MSTCYIALEYLVLHPPQPMVSLVHNLLQTSKHLYLKMDKDMHIMNKSASGLIFENHQQADLL